MCVSCTSPFLKPGGGADLRRRAVRGGVIDDAETIEFYKSVSQRKSAVRRGVDANGTCLGLCLSCYHASPPVGKRVAPQCLSLLHASVKTDTAASFIPGPACLPYLWGTQKEEAKGRLPRAEIEKVCAACKTAAEYRSRAVRRPPTRVPATVCGVPVPSTAVAVSRQCSLPGLAVAPNSGCVEALINAHLQRTRPEQISTVFPNGRTRTYQRVTLPIKSVVGPRRSRRRRAKAAGAASRAISADPSTVTAALSTILRRAKEHGDCAVAPLRSLSAQEQLRFNVSNRISGVTWSRFRAFLAPAVSGMATVPTLRDASAVASGEAANAVSTNDYGAFLVSPRAAVQGMVDDLVASGTFLERPTRSPEGPSASDGGVAGA